VTTYRFGDAELDTARRTLRVRGQDDRIGARAFDLLLALVERRERVVGKGELLDLVWPDTVVEENNLQVHVSTLRRVLGPQAITTIPGRGYRFTAPIDAAPGASAPAAAAPLARAQPVRAGNLPWELAPLYGRDEELSALCSLIEAHRLVTVLGAGGIGKSRLALAAAHSLADRYRDGAWLLELAGLSDPALLPNAVARVLGIRLATQDKALQELIGGLASRHLLLVLDNCEHLLEAVAALAKEVLHGSPGITLLLTSQEPLHLGQEQQYRIKPLVVPSDSTASGARQCGAVTLFEARLREVSPRFVLDDDSLAVTIEICRRLDGLPLAIELAAARAATLGLRPVRDRLDERFKLLTGGFRTALPRHQTLRAALAWSHQQLTDAEQAVFRRLGVFAGGCRMEMAQAVARDEAIDEWAVLDHLSTLVDKSLVVVDALDPPRYRLLESARAYALEQLGADEAAALRARYAQAVRHFFEKVDAATLDGELRTQELYALLLPELDNLRAAHTWAAAEGGDVQTAVSLASCASVLEDFAVECAPWLLSLRQRVEGGEVGDALAARYWRAMAASNMMERVPLSLQMQAAQRAQSLYKALAQPRRVFSSLVQLSGFLYRLGRLDESQACADEARGLIQPDWPAALRVRLLRADAYRASRAGQAAKALSLIREAVRMSQSTGDWLLEVIAREYLVQTLWRAGPIEQAVHEAGSLVDELNVRTIANSDMAEILALQTGILSEAGRIDEATHAARRGWPLMPGAQRYYLETWAHLFWRRGQIEAATLLLGAFDAQQERSDFPIGPNEQRLVEQARAGLAAQSDAQVFASRMNAGRALDTAEVMEVISRGIEVRAQS